MPEVCRFHGIVILMFGDEGIHHVAHFHVRYAEYKASVRADGTLLAGALPAPQLRAVRRWAALHESELRENWERLRREERPLRIAPLA